MAAVVVAQERAQGLLRNDVEADGGLVEKQHPRAVEQRGDELHLHALAEREFADHDVELVADVEQRDQFVERGLPLVAGQAVDVPQEQEGLAGGQVPPQLVLLAEDKGEEAAVGVFALGGIETRDARPAGGGVDEAGQHLECGRFAGAVGAEEADELALGDREADLVGGAHLLELAPEQTPHAAPEAGSLLVGAEDAGEMVNFNHRRKRFTTKSTKAAKANAESSREGSPDQPAGSSEVAQPGVVEDGVADETGGEAGDVGQRFLRRNILADGPDQPVRAVGIGRREEAGHKIAGGHGAAHCGVGMAGVR